MAVPIRYTAATATTAFQLKTTPGVVRRIIVPDPGSTWVISIYDATSGTVAATAVFSKQVAAGDVFDLNIPCTTGIRVNGTGTAGRAIITYT